MGSESPFPIPHYTTTEFENFEQINLAAEQAMARAAEWIRYPRDYMEENDEEERPIDFSSTLVDPLGHELERRDCERHHRTIYYPVPFYFILPIYVPCFSTNIHF